MKSKHLNKILVGVPKPRMHAIHTRVMHSLKEPVHGSLLFSSFWALSKARSQVCSTALVRPSILSEAARERVVEERGEQEVMAVTSSAKSEASAEASASPKLR